MKRFLFLFFILLIIITYGKAQSCLPNGIIFTNQSQIDNFPSNYPGCTTIEGSVFIQGANIQNIDSLYTISIIQDTLGIDFTNLVDLDGFVNLTNVGGDIFITQNEALENVEALSNLTEVEGWFWLFLNPLLSSVDGLVGVFKTSERVLLWNNESIQNLDGLSSLDTIQGTMSIQYHPSLNSIEGLINLKYVGGMLEFSSNDALFTLEGLNNLETIVGSLSITGNPIENLDALENLLSYGGLRLAGTSISDLSIFSDKTLSSGGGIHISNNNNLIDLQGFESITKVEALSVFNNASLKNLMGINNLDSIGYYLYFSDNPALTSLSGLNNLKYIGAGDLIISRCDSLLNLNELESLDIVNGNITIIDNLILNDLSGLDSLNFSFVNDLALTNNPNLSYCNTPILCNYLLDPNGDVFIYNNDAGCNSEEEVLYFCEFGPCTEGDLLITSQAQINELPILLAYCNSIIGDLIIEGADITNLDSLYIIDAVDGDLIINNNPNLVSLQGIAQIDPSSIYNLNISNNALLSDCDIESVCSFIAQSDSSIIIENNAPGCNTLSEAEAQCVFIPCLIEGINFYSQSDIDNFPSEHPGCDEIMGSVYIEGYDIDNLDSLIQITSIGGSLHMYGYFESEEGLSSFAGLDHLESIGGVFDVAYLKIHNFEGLGSLESIGEYMYVNECDSLINFIGLTNLNSITNGLSVAGCTALLNLEGLESLSNLESLDLYYNFSLNSLSGIPLIQSLQNLFIGSNSSLLDLNGLQNITNVANQFKIQDNWNLSSLNGINNLESVNGDLKIIHNDELENIDGLISLNYVGGNFNIGSSPQLTSLAGLANLSTVEGYVGFSGITIPNFQELSSLTTIGGELSIVYCHSIQDLSGFEAITNLGGSLTVRSNNSIQSMNGLQNLTSIGGYLEIGYGLGYGNESLISLDSLHNLTQINGRISVQGNNQLQSLKGLDNIESASIDFIRIKDNPLLYECDVLSICDYISTTNADVAIEYNNENCNSIEEVDYSCFLLPCQSGNLTFTTQEEIDNFSLLNPTCNYLEGDITISGNNITNLEGLNAIEIIGGGLWIVDNPILEDLNGLENLIYIENQLSISYNPSLQNVFGLQGLDSIGGNLKIMNNDLLVDLNGLSNLSKIGGDIKVYNNDALISLEGLNEIDPFSIQNLTISNNDSLSVCAIESVCDYLVSPNGEISILNNNSGCDSQEEVEVTCIPLAIEEIDLENNFVIHPNPANSTFYITSSRLIENLSIYNQIGQKVYSEKQVQKPIDVSNLESGIYILEFQVDKKKVREKLLVE